MDFVQGAFKYMCDDDFAIVMQYLGNDSMVTIPDVVEGRTVVGIYDKVFKGNTTINRITISDTVEKIGKEAFMNCTNLSEVVFYLGYTAKSTHKRKNTFTIGERAFKNCRLLEQMDTEIKYLKIGKEAFVNCENLNYVSQFSSAGPFCFKNCPCLEELFFANNFDLTGINLIWYSAQKRYYLRKTAILDNYAIDFLRRKNIQIICPESSTLADLAYEGINVTLESMYPKKH